MESSLLVASMLYVSFSDYKLKHELLARSKMSSRVSSSIASFEGKYYNLVISWAYIFSQIFFADCEAQFALFTKFLDLNIFDLCFLDPLDMMLPSSFALFYL
jgi:hypothetical protein